MQTNLTVRAETRTISIAAPPAAVFTLVADGARLPDWAPAFASAAEPDGDDRWLIGTGDAQFPIRVRADAEHGTVDLLRPADATVGAFMRVIPNGGGSELLFTLLFGDEVEPAAVDAQMTTVEGELATVRALAEGG
ncbi:MAG TPA: SRPBCC family protein [Baekduia sp.]|nr:SRPBCC family protein [Baekduia sp.]